MIGSHISPVEYNAATSKQQSINQALLYVKCRARTSTNLHVPPIHTYHGLNTYMP
jgi:hypothetical protein